MAAAQHSRGRRQVDAGWVDGLFHMTGPALDTTTQHFGRKNALHIKRLHRLCRMVANIQTSSTCDSGLV